MPKKIETGTVTSAASSKTRRVEIPRIVRHPKYGRILHSRTVCHVHDETEESAVILLRSLSALRAAGQNVGN